MSPNRRSRPARIAAAVGAALSLAACAAQPLPPERQAGPPPSAPVVTAPTATAPTIPEGTPDARGVVVYRDYAAIVAREGDTVESMAARAGVSASELAAYNGLPVGYRPRRGDELVLPPRAEGYRAAAAPAPTAETAPPSIAMQPLSAPLSQPLEEVAAAPAEEAGGWSPARIGEAIGRGPQPAEPAPIPAGAAGTYSEVLYHQVQEGETIYSISRQYGVAAETLIAWNALSGPAYAVRPGQVLTIPSGASAGPGGTAWTTAPGQGGPAAPPPSAGAPLPAEPAQPSPLPSPQLDRYQTPAVQPAPAPAPAAPAATTAAAPPPPAEPAPAAVAARAPDRLLRPVPGRVLRPYSRESGPGRNDGVDFAAQPGEAVAAAADGTVALISNSLGEWGTIVLVRHDERLMTVYGRMGEVAVERGQQVRAGQRLGSVAPAESGQTYLHFEVRRGAFSEDPMTFF